MTTADADLHQSEDAYSSGLRSAGGSLYEPVSFVGPHSII